MNSTDYTFADSKYSCFSFMFYPHVVLSYLIVISGLLAFITRFVLKSLHTWMGRFYIIFMIWNIALSLLIHNTGLPLAIIISFIYVLSGLTIGWILICIHKEKKPILNTPLKRIFSYKSMHGIMMFLSWINIAGRVPFSDIKQDFKCYTHPYNKLTYQLVPSNDPVYNTLPWSNTEDKWALMLGLGPIAFGFLVCVIYVLAGSGWRANVSSEHRARVSNN